jgi:hypothetical protein
VALTGDHGSDRPYIARLLFIADGYTDSVGGKKVVDQHALVGDRVRPVP